MLSFEKVDGSLILCWSSPCSFCLTVYLGDRPTSEHESAIILFNDYMDYSTMWMLHSLYKQLPIDGQSCAITKIAAMNNLVHMKMF